MKPKIKQNKITMIKWKEYIKNIHNNNIKNDKFWNKIRKQITTKSNEMIIKNNKWQ